MRFLSFLPFMCLEWDPKRGRNGNEAVVGCSVGHMALVGPFTTEVERGRGGHEENEKLGSG